MSTLITTIWSSFQQTISGLAGGLKGAFSAILYVDPAAAEPVVSDLAQFGFLMFGLSIAMGLVFMAFRLIKNRG
jgi:hypothetical protein